jgi:hypothetical protein
MTVCIIIPQWIFVITLLVLHIIFASIAIKYWGEMYTHYPASRPIIGACGFACCVLFDVWFVLPYVIQIAIQIIPCIKVIP